MTTPDWKPVANALLGTWPSQVNSWGPEVLAAYCSEIAARGVTPERALVAVRAYSPDADFPPSAAKLAQVARNDPAAPQGIEVAEILWGIDGVMHARAPYPIGGWEGHGARQAADDQARLDAATAHGPLVTAFVGTVGMKALKDHDARDDQWGGASRRWIEQQWEAFTEKADERGVAEMLATGNIDPLAGLRRVSATRQIGAA